MSDHDAPNPSQSSAVAQSTEEQPVADEEAFAAKLWEEVESSSPLTCPISYSGPGDADTVNKAIALLKVYTVLLRRRHPWLTFDSLESIVFHSDYALALKEIGERTGRPCEATSEASGVGIAMVVNLEDKCIAVLDAGVALGIADSSDQAKHDLCVDTALHELCHVYDYGRKRRLLSHEFLKRRVAPIEMHVFTAADATWSEYFANKYSNSSCSSPDMHPKYLAEVVPDVVSDVKEAIRAYRTHRQLDVLLSLCQQKVRFLFQCFGYAAGRLAANEAALEEVAPESVSALQAAGLWQRWLDAFAELRRLDGCRETWASFDELKPLMRIADDVFRDLGLNYREDAGVVHVDVPKTPDTMPSNPLAQLFGQMLARPTSK
ncbi:hypothetical protein [Pelomonas sp. Root1444]|uniref:hypothetical protein n=1 Tax=Pelomonas sp. Root1444 TaxID=1736464 RepID=UPI000702C6DD|nr:hypothetical protein [Pelomonas sp. Root1444]KQY82314.1 hypothetical protein ASD35_25380 [Pelomonas sp. Root1444]